MKKFFTFCLMTCLVINVFAYAPGDTITLDLTTPTNPATFTFNAADAWTETYNETGYGYIESQVFGLSHLPSGQSYGGMSYEGFTVCKVAADSGYFGCMARGGVAGVGTPYVLGYYSEYYSMMNSTSSNQVIFTTGEQYDAVGMYVCNNPVAYKAITQGDAYARKFAAGDSFVLKAEALDASFAPTGQSVSFYLADYRSENPAEWTVNNTWEWFDMSSLGRVGGIAFSVSSTDMAYGFSNTATYFAMDKLKVAVPKTTDVSELMAQKITVYPNPFVDYVEVTNAQAPVEIYTLAGVKVLSTNESRINTSTLATGVYVLKCGNQTVKIIK